jgi:putative intracellular protease/amidase
MAMKTEGDVKNLEKLIGQLQSLHAEISQLAKKSANDGLNVFKLGIVNGILANADLILLDGYKPLESFNGFEEDALPTNSDVAMILALYMEQVERFRSDNVVYDQHGWQYAVNGTASGIISNAPTRIWAHKK